MVGQGRAGAGLIGAHNVVARGVRHGHAASALQRRRAAYVQSHGAVADRIQRNRARIVNGGTGARKDTARYRMTKFIARHKVAVAATAIVVLTLAIGIAVTVHEARIAQRRFDDVRSLASSLIF